MMRMTWVLAICTVVAGCAKGGSAVDQARNDHDLGVTNDVKLALTSQIATDRRNVDGFLHRAGAAPDAIP